MKILVVDEADGSADAQDLIKRFAPDKTIRLGGMCNGIGQVMSDITNLAPMNGITRLIIKGHGNTGVQVIGAGKGTVTSADGTSRSILDRSLPASAQGQFSVLNLAYLSDPANSQTVAMIAPYFDQKGIVELYGCHTGDGANGQELLKKLAKLWNVPVLASTWYNFVQSENFSGSVVTAFPDGHVETKSWLSADSLSIMAREPARAAVVTILEGWRRLTSW